MSDSLTEPAARPLSYAEAALLVQTLGIRSIQEYRQVYRHHLGLLSTPNQQYAAEWCGWPQFLQRSSREYRFLPYHTAQQLAQVQGWTTARAYLAGYGRHPGLPRAPEQVYADQWPGWRAFLGRAQPSKRLSYLEAVTVVRAAHLRTSSAYFASYKDYPGLPRHPVRAYAQEWRGWYAFLLHEDGFFTYAEAKAYLATHHVSLRVHYLRMAHDQVRLPRSPQQVYRGEWAGWPLFLHRPLHAQNSV